MIEPLVDQMTPPTRAEIEAYGERLCKRDPNRWRMAQIATEVANGDRLTLAAMIRDSDEYRAVAGALAWIASGHAKGVSA